MRGLIVRPGVPDSLELRELPEPNPSDGDTLVEVLLVGICGTDRDIVAGRYGAAPPGEDFLVLGHEALVRILEAPPDSGFEAGDLAVPMVRHPDPGPCPACALDEWDMCRNGEFTEHGIVARHGFARERLRIPSTRLVPVPRELGALGALVEPASVVVKAWEQTARVGARAFWLPERCLVTGAGPVGLLAALLGRQQGLALDVYDAAEGGLKAALVMALGARYRSAPTVAVAECAREADIVIECTGAGALVLDVIEAAGPGSIVCLAGLSAHDRRISLNADSLNRSLVLENRAILGTVSANEKHYRRAVEALQTADASWLERLLTRTVPCEDFADAFSPRPDDIKVLLELTPGRL